MRGDTRRVKGVLLNISRRVTRCAGVGATCVCAPLMTGNANVRPVDGPTVTDRDKH